ncbi:hypothetical protein RvY_14425-2 [Ramazzottius varieornatus]|uniref:PHD-type domain-containing protein n=1 Tax=Ramazzottius varieornatus TaxID=947166 RepID=A0A1D1VR96_RAMVA|nr:hypothetical protein RvY_14425-2 [Ramazzottius varieornatus]
MSDVPSTSAGLPAQPVTLGGIRLGSLPTSGQSVQFQLPRLSPSFAQAPLPARALPPAAPVVRFIAPAQSPTIRYVSISPSPGGSFGIPAPLPQRAAPGSVVYVRKGLMAPIIPPGQAMPASLKVPPFKANTIFVPAPSSSKASPSSPKKKDPRGRKPMTAMQKAESKKQRDMQKLKGVTKSGKRGRGRPRKTNTLATDYAAEMDEIKSKISNRFDSNKKKPIKKEDAGYFGPYIRSFIATKESDDEADKASFNGKSVPLPNIIVDNFEAHLALPEAAQKMKYKPEKQTGVVLEEPFVCAFCHLDPAAERETAMGDLIGPIVMPGRAAVVTQKKPGDNSTSGSHGSVYLHEKCLEWSSNFRMIGFAIVDLQVLFDDAKTVCSICKRKGATMGCSAPGACSKSFHYPCAKLSGCKMVDSSHQVFCEEHKDMPSFKRRDRVSSPATSSKTVDRNKESNL